MELAFQLIVSYLVIGTVVFSVTLGIYSVKENFRITLEDDDCKDWAKTVGIIAFGWPIFLILGALWCIFLGPAKLINHFGGKAKNRRAAKRQAKEAARQKALFPHLEATGQEIEGIQTGWQ